MINEEEVEKAILKAVQKFAAAAKNRRSDYLGMAELISLTSKLPIRNLDYWERLIRGEYSSIVGASTTTQWWRRTTVKNRPLTYIDIFSWDGYRREKALRTLVTAAPNGFFVAFALRRLNDWVPEVRLAARETLPQLTEISEKEYVVDAIVATFMHWGSWSHMGIAEKQVLLDIATSETIMPIFKRKIIEESAGPMATLLAQIGRSSAIDCFLPDIASASVQPSVRAKAYRSLMEGKMTWLEGRKWVWTDIRYCEGRMVPVILERTIYLPSNFLDNLKSAAADKSSAVRKVAAELFISRVNDCGSEAESLAKRFADDNCQAVAERGKFAERMINESKNY